QSDKHDEQIAYTVGLLDERGPSAGLSSGVRVPAPPTSPPPPSVNAEPTTQGIHLSWSCGSQIPGSIPAIQYRIRIYRRAQGDRNDVKVGEVDFNFATSSLVDLSFECEKTYKYRASVITLLNIAKDKT